MDDRALEPTAFLQVSSQLRAQANNEYFTWLQTHETELANEVEHEQSSGVILEALRSLV